VNAIWEFIIKYWLEFVFGLIASGIVTGVTLMYKQRKKRTEDRQEQMNREIAENIKTILDDY
jgi:hypothetical protein